ncbi:MAG: hypothetical protein M5U34_10395 [Chloroflexi bacterium]|nr:hypothetical protein [Chloroflexota bacterium]
MMAALDAAPILLNETSLTGELNDWENRLVVAQGAYDFSNELALIVQSWQGMAGLHLITPLVLDGGETADSCGSRLDTG